MFCCWLWKMSLFCRVITTCSTAVIQRRPILWSGGDVPWRLLAKILRVPLEWQWHNGCLPAAWLQFRNEDSSVFDQLSSRRTFWEDGWRVLGLRTISPTVTSPLETMTIAESCLKFNAQVSNMLMWRNYKSTRKVKETVESKRKLRILHWRFGELQMENHCVKKKINTKNYWN